jgi:hypothetical protein
MGLLDLALATAEVELEPFVAPIPDAHDVYVWTIQDEVPYRVRIWHPDPGWWWVEPTAQTRGRIFEPAGAGEILEYLDELPRIYVIILFRVAERTWLCTPLNAADAAQRGWASGEPRVLHLAWGTIEPYDVVSARLLSQTVLFDSVADRLESRLWTEHAQVGNATSADFARAMEIVNAEIDRRRKEEREKALAEQRTTLEGNIRWHLEFAGANLVGWKEQGEGVRVEWEYGGQRYDMRVSRNMRIESAGVCLSGGDRHFNLSSIVSVMEERNRRYEDDDDW